MRVSRCFASLCVIVILAGCGSDSKPPPTDGGAVAQDGGATLDGGGALDGGASIDGGAVIDGGPAADGGPVTDGGQPGDGGVNCPTGPDGGAPCNTLTNSAPSVARQRVDQNLPSFTGGTVVAGTYFSTALTIYTGPGGATGPDGHYEQTTVVISGNSIQVVSTKGDGCMERFNATYSTSGNQMTLTFTCGGEAPSQTLQYTATATTLSLNVESNRVLTLTRQ